MLSYYVTHTITHVELYECMAVLYSIGGSEIKLFEKDT